MKTLSSWFLELRQFNVYTNKCVVNHVEHGDKILIYKKKKEETQKLT